MRRRFGFTTAAMLMISALPARAQEARRPESGGMTPSLGQPRSWHRHSGAGAGWIFEESGAALVAEGRLGMYTDLVNPLVGMLGFQAEAYYGARGDAFDYGVRTQLVSPFFRLGLGFDFNGLDRDAYVLLSLFHPIRRGGLLGKGSQLRVNYLPARRHSFSVGVEIPVDRRISMGRTRPPSAEVHLESPRARPTRYEPPDSALVALRAELRESALWISRLTMPFLEQSDFSEDEATRKAVRELEEIRDYIDRRALEEGGDWGQEAEVRRFHEILERAFTIASTTAPPANGCGASFARETAAEARRLILNEVIVPYDRLLGQVKEDDSILGFGMNARGMFLRWLYTEARSPRECVRANLWVFAEVVAILEEVRSVLHERWADSRFVWLPLQLALLPEEHDTQAELDALVEKIAHAAFTEGNRVWYVVNEQFPLELSRQIHSALQYHVLWIHDIRGLDGFGNPDEMTFRHVLGSYLGALTERVRDYDRTGVFPVFMIFLDQWYYEANRSRFWLDLLEDPLRHKPHLPGDFEAWEDTIMAAQESLREAVARSQLLQEQAAQFGKSWLRNLVKVHVSITNPADPSYWRAELIPIWGLPDNVMRDHRKIAFYDVTEEDPYRGGAIYTGAGVGEHYTALNWEDRAIRAEGPALLTLKHAARDLLLNQGIEPEKIPWSLQSRPLAEGYAAKVAAYRDTATLDVRALELHNQTGYNSKDLTVVKAVLYSMMPAGSVAIVPDGLWNAGFWGGMLVGHSLRGGRTLIVAPGKGNAPSTKMAGLARIREVMSRVLLAGQILGREIEECGGFLKVGIYSPTYEVTDLHAKLSGFSAALAKHAWYRELFRFQPQVYSEIAVLLEELRDQNERRHRALEFEQEGTPKLHLKANFLASREAWDGLLQLPGWAAVLRVFLFKRAWQIENRDLALGHLETPVPDVIEVGQPMLDEWLAGLTPERRDRLVLYLLLGSANQDYRSLALDGEAAFLVAGTSVNAGLIDLVGLSGQCVWVESIDELADLLPDPGAWTLRITRWLKLLL